MRPSPRINWPGVAFTYVLMNGALLIAGVGPWSFAIANVVLSVFIFSILGAYFNGRRGL